MAEKTTKSVQKTEKKEKFDAKKYYDEKQEKYLNDVEFNISVKVSSSY